MIGQCLSRFNERATIRQKTNILFIFLMVIIILTFGEISNSLYKMYILELAEKDLNQKTEMLKKDLEFRLSHYEKTSWFLYNNRTLLEILLAYQGEMKSYDAVFDDYKVIDRLLMASINSETEYIPRIYHFSSRLPSDGRYVHSIQDYPDKKAIETIMENDSVTTWSHSRINRDGGEHDYFIVSRVIKDTEKDIPLAILNIEVDLRAIAAVISNIDVGSKGWFVLKFADGSEIITHGRKDLVKNTPGEPIIKKTDHTAKSGSGAGVLGGVGTKTR